MRKARKSTPVVLSIALLAAGAVAPAAAAAETPEPRPESAWDALVQTESLSTLQSYTALERRVLDVLDPAAAARFLAGADPAAVEAIGGGDLGSYLSGLAAPAGEVLTFVPVEPCRIADTRLALGKLRDGETRSYVVRGAATDYSPQGGNPNGCGIPDLSEAVALSNVARAVLFNFKLLQPEGDGELRAWPSSHPRTAIPLAEYAALERRGVGTDSPGVVRLCDEVGVDPCRFGDLRASVTRGAHLVIEVHGYFLADVREVPAGAIVMWSGALAGIPAGWALCDGANGTPDLRDRFVLGAAAGEEPGAVGGAHSYALSEDQLAPHAHPISIESAGSHSHSYSRPTAGFFPNLGLLLVLGANVAWDIHSSQSAGTSAAGLHSHAATIGSSGGGALIDNRPAFYRLAFLMKL